MECGPTTDSRCPAWIMDDAELENSKKNWTAFNGCGVRRWTSTSTEIEILAMELFKFIFVGYVPKRA